MNVLYRTTPRSLRKSQNQTVRQHLDSFAEIWILAPQAKILTFQIVVLLIFATGNSISAPYNPQKFPPAAPVGSQISRVFATQRSHSLILTQS